MAAIRKSVSTSTAEDRSATSVSRAAIRSSKSDIDLLHRVGCATDGRGRAGVGEGDKSPRPRAIVRAARAVWRWLNAQDDQLVTDVLGVISLCVLLYVFLVAPVIAGWE